MFSLKELSFIYAMLSVLDLARFELLNQTLKWWLVNLVNIFLAPRVIYVLDLQRNIFQMLWQGGPRSGATARASYWIIKFQWDHVVWCEKRLLHLFPWMSGRPRSSTCGVVALLYCSIEFKLLNLSLREKPNCRVVLTFSYPKEGTKLDEVPLLHH